MSLEWVKIEVPQLIRKKVDSAGDMVKTEYDHTIYELEGDALDLAGVSNELLDKKLIKTKESATLDFKNMPIEGEGRLY
jgi:uncharacterized protein YqkB